MGMLGVQRMAESEIPGFYFYKVHGIIVESYNINLYKRCAKIMGYDEVPIAKKKTACPPLAHVSHSATGRHEYTNQLRIPGFLALIPRIPRGNDGAILRRSRLWAGLLAKDHTRNV